MTRLGVDVVGHAGAALHGHIHPLAAVVVVHQALELAFDCLALEGMQQLTAGDYAAQRQVDPALGQGQRQVIGRGGIGEHHPRSKAHQLSHHLVDALVVHGIGRQVEHLRGPLLEPLHHPTLERTRARGHP